MDSTAFVAALGLMSTLVAGWFSASWQRRANREDRILEAKVRVYGECATALYDYERITYNRARTRLEESIEERTSVRDEAYRASSRIKASIGQVAILSGSEGLKGKFEDVRKLIKSMNQAVDVDDLKNRQGEATQAIDAILQSARNDLVGAQKSEVRARA